MLITSKTIAQLQIMLNLLETLPAEGKDLDEVTSKEHSRVKSIEVIRRHVSANIAPTIVQIDDYWGARLGLING